MQNVSTNHDLSESENNVLVARVPARGIGNKNNKNFVFFGNISKIRDLGPTKAKIETFSKNIFSKDGKFIFEHFIYLDCVGWTKTCKNSARRIFGGFKIF